MVTVSRYLKHLFLALPVVMAILIFWFLQRPAGVDTEEEWLDGPASEEGGDLVTDIHLVQFDGKQTHWTLDAPRARRQTENRIHIRWPELTVFQKMQEPMVIQANFGAFDMKERIMVFYGNVKMAGNGHHLATERLRFNPRRGMLYTDRAFHFQDDRVQLEGVGLTQFQDAQTIEVKRQVKMRIRTDHLGMAPLWN